MSQILVYLTHKNGAVDDCALELAAVARKIDPAGAPIAILSGIGSQLHDACKSLSGAFSEVWKVANQALSHPNAEVVRKALVKIVPANSIVLMAHDHFGIDLAPGLSVNLNAAFVSDILDVEVLDSSCLKVARQEFGGQFSAHVRCDVSSGAVITVRPGAFRATETAPVQGTIVEKTIEVGELTARRRYVETIEPEAGDVDITKQNILVSVGRGIQEQDNIHMAEELAEALEAAVSCSRPVVDAKWLPKSRQVGSSGKTVKPKLYLACGISGASQHLAGIKGSFLIAINKNAKAPIFQVADVGIVDDILEFLPELTNKVRETHAVSSK
ncbi:MAG TPA: electron transfer flavoprotein subunit alpha/FixB family protein [Terriglobales bacterium]|nr:electron transfer flavoprotein subunit alpha/FixB family protein [Terriglobales bacterium]